MKNTFYFGSYHHPFNRNILRDKSRNDLNIYTHTLSQQNLSDMLLLDATGEEEKNISCRIKLESATTYHL